ncbi:hypothetical protein ASPACDRAFT_75452 [Aspergillus aculeatus ATCC 16872]|uniref:BRCT domain-containing protein n=1 Tax=Aspergillus aculeatus (strain ATCC 16872 / CBS 172.66 / WB 5094) TaxID=690307 RepID=A0A1L9X6I9_ASPA1|nr:uncharacterized protein ASPACDRAFT_75452 [Aspergillus aculeatus ATCC 16872]OJK03934.1 hypothetical protein ASPACDRAFT_75452 [Aspergillus aculeatus ATCC 16872]
MARAAIIPQSPPKRATRTRTKGTTTTTATTTTASSRTAPKTTKAKAPSSATEARKRGVRTASVTTTTTATAKRPVKEEDSDATTDDEIDMFAGSRRRNGTATSKPKGRPPAAKAGASAVAPRTRKTPVVATPAAAESDSDNDDELAQSETVPKKRAGRPKAKPATAAADAKEADKAAAAAAPKTRGRPKGTAAAKLKVVDELKENTRLNAKGFTDIDFSSSQEAPRQLYITTHSSSVRSNMLRGPAKKKKVTFQDPTDTDADELNEPSPPPAGRRRGAAAVSGRQGGLASKPVRKPAATSGRGRKPAAAKKDDSSKPLSPKKATQVAKGLSSYASSDGEDDELSADKEQMKAILQSPPKHGSENTGPSSPVKKINLTGRHFRKSLDENGDPLPGPRRSVDFNDNNLLLSSPARRPPPSPFNFTMRETPRRGGGLTLRSDIKPLSQPTLSPTLNSPLRLSPKKASLETPRRGNLFGTSTGSVSQPNFTPGLNSPLKSSPRKGLFGASFMSQSQPEPSATPLRHSTSLLQSPAKKVATPFKASLSVMKSPVPEESEHENDNEEEPGDNDTFDDSHLEESPLRLMKTTRVETQADEEDETTQDVASEENDDIDPVSTTPPHSPSLARHYENSAVNGDTTEHDSGESVEYVEDDASTVAEDVAEVVEENVEDGDQTEDQAMEEDAGSMAEESDIDDMEEVDPAPEHADVPMEETGEEVTQDAAEESEENPNAEPIEDVDDENVEESNEDSLGEPVVEAIPESQHQADKERDDLQVAVESEDGAKEHKDGPVIREISVDATLDDASDGDNQEQDDDRVNLDQDMPETVSDAENSHQNAIGQERAATPNSVLEEVDHSIAEEQHTPIPNIRNGVAKDLDDVFVDEPTLPEQANQRLDSSDTEDDPDMMETDDDVDAAEDDLSRDQQEDIIDDCVFEENEPTIVVAEPTEIIPRSRVPILPYEVEEPENPWSPIREAYYRAMKNISPVRVLPDSPVRRNMSFESTADSPSPIRQGFTVDTSGNQDPFVDSNSGTPLLRRSIKRSIFDNAPRFTPLAQQFSQWEASSPARFQPRRSQRPRKGIFSLGGSRRSSSNVLPTPVEVTYPQIDSQAEEASEEPAQSEAADADAEISEDEGPQIDKVVGQSVHSEEIDANETTEVEPEAADENVDPQNDEDYSHDLQAEETEAAEAVESTETAEHDSRAEEAGAADENVDPQNDEDHSHDLQAEETEAAEALESTDTAEQVTEVVEGPEDHEDFSETPALEEPGTTEDAELMSEEDESEIYEGLSQSSRPLETNNTETTEPAEFTEQSTGVVDGTQIFEDFNQRSQTEETIVAQTEEPVTEEVDDPQIYEDPSQDSQLEAYSSENIQEREDPLVDMPNGTEAEATLSNYTEEAPGEELVMEITSASKSPVPAIDAFDDNKENEVFSNIPLFTPVKNRIPQMQTVHTVSKVPLKPEGQISPLKISRKRGLSLSGASPIRASTRIRTSTFAPTQQTDPPLLPRKSPRLQRVSMTRPVAPVTQPAEPKNERSTPAKRPPQSPSPTKSAKAPRRSMSAPAPKLALQGAVVYVDVHTTEGEDASGIFIELLQQMGARCIKNWCWNPRASLAPEEGLEPKEGKVGVTHVVFKDGSARTLEKVRHARGLVKCVGVGWVLDCERENKWLDETSYAVDSSIIPRGGAKRRKSMEPRALSNVNGTLVRATATAPALDRRRSGAISRDTMESFARDHSTPPLSSREELEQEESGSTATPPEQIDYTVGHTEPDQRYCHTPQTPGSSAYTFDMDAIGMSPATPFYLSQRTKLVQQTCPPKQTRQGLFTTPGPVREPNQKLRSKLEAARRKSMAYKPRVGSPLVE